MAKRILRIAGLILLLGCCYPWFGNPLAYVHWKDRFRTSFPVAMVLGLPCWKDEGDHASYSQGPDCFRYDATERFSGIFFTPHFERSSFYQGAQALPADTKSNRGAWLDFTETAVASIDPNVFKGHHIFRIEFTGRKTSAYGDYANGLYHQLIWADRVISVQPLDSKSPTP